MKKTTTHKFVLGILLCLLIFAAPTANAQVVAVGPISSSLGIGDETSTLGIAMTNGGTDVPAGACFINVPPTFDPSWY